ncbi:MAG: aspartate kinase [Oligoflexales bacterium]|nr:aspartate kinase [Oligoflexales bacterium]
MYSRFDKNAVIVQKYGGTSVGTPERIKAVAARVARMHRQGYKNLAIVVSAMSGETNRLVSLVNESNPHASMKAYDVAIAAGEQVTVGLLTAALEAEKIEASPYLAYRLNIRTDDAHGRARIQSIDTSLIEEDWRNNRVAVIAGFQGVNRHNDITTLGRGGSDTSAVAVAAALKADFCEINTDVDGVFTADPRVVETASLIQEMDYEACLELASMGSKVLHPRCVELAAKYKIPLIVRNTFKPDDADRTIVMDLKLDMIEDTLVSGVTIDKDVASFMVAGASMDAKFITLLFQHIADKKINVDVIIHEKNQAFDQKTLGFTVSESDAELTENALVSLNKSHGSLQWQKTLGLSKVTAVGVGMRSNAGVAATFFTALSSHNIEVKMISTSEIKISAVIDKADGAAAVKALHKAFIS